MSNIERQRRFRKRHPGYFQRIHAKNRAALKAHAEQMALAQQAAHAALIAQEAEQRQPLMLPAPVETIEIPGMTTIGEAIRSGEAIEVSR
jgi:hypothetical protein